MTDFLFDPPLSEGVIARRKSQFTMAVLFGGEERAFHCPTTGRGRYVIQDISGYERHEAERTLLAQLDLGKRAADERGTLATEQARSIFAERFAQEA